MGLYRRALTALQRTLDLLTGLRKVRENIPQKETVTEVIKVSCLRMLLSIATPSLILTSRRNAGSW